MCVIFVTDYDMILVLPTLYFFPLFLLLYLCTFPSVGLIKFCLFFLTWDWPQVPEISLACTHHLQRSGVTHSAGIKYCYLSSQSLQVVGSQSLRRCNLNSATSYIQLPFTHRKQVFFIIPTRVVFTFGCILLFAKSSRATFSQAFLASTLRSQTERTALGLDRSMFEATPLSYPLWVFDKVAPTGTLVDPLRVDAFLYGSLGLSNDLPELRILRELVPVRLPRRASAVPV